LFLRPDVCHFIRVIRATTASLPMIGPELAVGRRCV